MCLSEVDDPLTRAMSNLKPICSKTLKANLAATIVAVERKVSAENFGPYGLIPTIASTYVALFDTYWADDGLR
ncbi:Hypothetical protein PHPALM_11516 [Phytophthora palmivora]|uniref:Uncharacterized protein n=1 Tax=Phytophthora palmivora TaxID=4796 RepID=A0A2P4Y2C3_9STRA|nr:Hypothetical protein PHPALM_11516 [Phytophthora palmivora]